MRTSLKKNLIFSFVMLLVAMVNAGLYAWLLCSVVKQKNFSVYSNFNPLLIVSICVSGAVIVVSLALLVYAVVRNKLVKPVAFSEQVREELKGLAEFGKVEEDDFEPVFQSLAEKGYILIEGKHYTKIRPFYEGDDKLEKAVFEEMFKYDNEFPNYWHWGLTESFNRKHRGFNKITRVLRYVAMGLFALAYVFSVVPFYATSDPNTHLFFPTNILIAAAVAFVEFIIIFVPLLMPFNSYVNSTGALAGRSIFSDKNAFVDRYIYLIFTCYAIFTYVPFIAYEVVVNKLGGALFIATMTLAFVSQLFCSLCLPFLEVRTTKNRKKYGQMLGHEKTMETIKKAHKE